MAQHGRESEVLGDLRQNGRAAAGVVRRLAPRMIMMATLLILGILAWPDEPGTSIVDSADQGPVVRKTAAYGEQAAGADHADSPETDGSSDRSEAGDGSTDEPAMADGQTDDTDNEAAESEPSQTTTAPSCFSPIFRDDFDGDKLGSDWTVYHSKGNHSPHAIRRPEAVTLVDGKLVITARNDEDGVLASGGLRHNHEQTYGRYAVRVRTDADLSNATSGVVLTWPVSESQPLDGENNMYETLRTPGDRTPFYSFIHEPFDESADGISQTEFVHHGDATQWQELAMEWTPGYLEIHWTNQETGEVASKRLTETARDLITDAEHFLAIQLDLFKGVFPDDRQVQMEVDWVEVHSYTC